MGKAVTEKVLTLVAKNSHYVIQLAYLLKISMIYQTIINN